MVGNRDLHKTYSVCYEHCQQNVQDYASVSKAVTGFSYILITPVIDWHDNTFYQLLVSLIAIAILKHHQRLPVVLGGVYTTPFSTQKQIFGHRFGLPFTRKR